MENPQQNLPPEEMSPWHDRMAGWGMWGGIAQSKLAACSAEGSISQNASPLGSRRRHPRLSSPAQRGRLSYVPKGLHETGAWQILANTGLTAISWYFWRGAPPFLILISKYLLKKKKKKLLLSFIRNDLDDLLLKEWLLSSFKYILYWLRNIKEAMSLHILFLRKEKEFFLY